MRIGAWLFFCFVGVALAMWLLHDWEFSNERVFLVEGATLTMDPALARTAAENTRESVPEGLLLLGHHVSSGDGLVLALRRDIWRPFAILGPTEKARFEYLTILLRSDAEGRATIYNSPAQGSDVFWSEANAGFFFDDGCFGYAKKGTATVRYGAGGKASAVINLDIETVPVSQFTLYSCNSFVFTGEYQLEVLDVTEFDQELATRLIDAGVLADSEF